MKMSNYLIQQVLLLLLYILRVLTVANGARDSYGSSKERTQTKSSTGAHSLELAQASPALPLAENLTREYLLIFEHLAALGLNELLEGRDPLSLHVHKQASRATYQDDAQSGEIVGDSGFMPQSEIPERSGEESPTGAKDAEAQALCSGATGARPKVPCRSPSKSPSMSRPSKIPIRPSRSHSALENSRSSSMSPPLVSSPTAKFVQSAAQTPFSKLGRLSVESRYQHTGRASRPNLQIPPEQSDVLNGATRHAAPASSLAAWQPQEKQRSTTPVVHQPWDLEAEYRTSSYSAPDDNALESSNVEDQRSHWESFMAAKVPLKCRKEKCALLRRGRPSAESGPSAKHEEVSDSASPPSSGYSFTDASEQSYTGTPAPSRLQTRFRRRAPSRLPDVRNYLTSQSLETSFADLFETVRPELVDIAQSLDMRAAGVLSREDVLTGHIVSNIFNRKKSLKIAPLGKSPPAPQDFRTFRAEAERLLGIGGSSMVYKVKLAGLMTEDREDRWAVKVHHSWIHEDTGGRSIGTLRNTTEEKVLNVSRSLCTQYTPDVLFSKFRFLTPYYYGEILNMDPVLLPHHTDNHKFLLNLVTVMPLMPVSFDTVLGTKQLTPAAKRVICFSFVELVARLHLQMLVHADLKPANFFLSSHGEVYLGDFETVGWQNSLRRCGSMATVHFLDPEEAQCHVLSPNKLIPMTAARDAWSLGLSLFLVWCGVFPFKVLSQKVSLNARKFVSLLRTLVPEETGGDSTTPKLDFGDCPGGRIADGLVLELIQRFLELDPKKRWTPIAGYKVILTAADSARKAVKPAFF